MFGRSLGDIWDVVEKISVSKQQVSRTYAKAKKNLSNQTEAYRKLKLLCFGRGCMSEVGRVNSLANPDWEIVSFVRT